MANIEGQELPHLIFENTLSFLRMYNTIPGKISIDSRKQQSHLSAFFFYNPTGQGRKD